MKRWRFTRVIIWSAVILILCLLPLNQSSIDTPKIPHLDKIAHFGLFFLFSAFLYSWLHTQKPAFRLKNIIYTLIIAGIYGALIEWLQENYFSRTGDIFDWIADMIGSIFGIFCYPIIHHVKQYFIKKVIN